MFKVYKQKTRQSSTLPTIQDSSLRSPICDCLSAEQETKHKEDNQKQARKEKEAKQTETNNIPGL